MRRVSALIIAILILPAAALASPFDTFGFGARAISMGGAYAAVGGDSASLFYNIATMNKAGTFQIDLGYHHADIAMSFNGRQTDIDPDKGLNIGFIIGKHAFKHRFSIGAMIYTPDDHFVRLVMPPRTAITPIRYNNINHIQGAISGLAVEIFPWWHIGAGASFVSWTTGGVDFVIRDDAPAEGYAKSVVGSNTVPTAGTFFEPLDWLGIGFCFRDKQNMEMELTNVIHMPDLKILKESGLVVLNNGRLDLLVTSYTHFSPRQFALGFSFKPTDRLLLSADGTYYQWSQMKSSVAFSVAVMSGDLGKVFPTLPPLPLPNQRMRDTFGVAAGVEGTPVDGEHFKLDIRGGYNYQPSPVKEQTGLSNMADTDVHQVSAGLGFTFKNFSTILPKPISLDVFDQFHYFVPRTMNKSDPTNDVGSYTITGNANNVGAAVTLRF